MFIWLFSITAFLGASLLFVVQPMVGKLILPLFGGSSMVWTAVMLFFTCILLLGYGYVVWLSKLSKRLQFFVHTGVIILSLGWLLVNFLSLHAFFSTGTFSAIQSAPVFSLLLILMRILALPCFLLAATSPLIQSWYAGMPGGKSPYWLYVISNAGSLVGLLSYPILIEPNLTLSVQQNAWVVGIVFYSVLMIIVSYVSYLNINAGKIKEKFRILTGRKIFAWIALPFVSTGIMLALTAKLTSSISPIPLIWVATLGIYLLSFIIAFIEKQWYSDEFYGILALSLIVVLGISTSGYLAMTYQNTLAVSLVSLFFIDLICHRKLYDLRPDHENLPYFYLMIGIGGMIASVFAAVLAPIIFSDFWEYPILLCAAALVAVYVLLKRKELPFRIHSIIFGGIVIYFTIRLFVGSQEFIFGGKNIRTIAKFRNFYGVIRIVMQPNLVQLYNGVITHGSQVIGSQDEYVPTLYYRREAGLGYAILNNFKMANKLPIRIGVVGLGAGTTAAYCGKGDYIRFYEINPKVIEVSKRYFTYLSNAERSGCKIEIVEGDARISLEKELQEGKRGNFDVLSIDAFTDDSVPIHLLTSEAIDLYLSHLSNDGVIAVHISSRFLDFGSVFEAIAGAKNLYFQVIDSYGSSWVLLSKNSTGARSYIPKTPNTKPWTDNYNNLLQIFYKPQGN